MESARIKELSKSSKKSKMSKSEVGPIAAEKTLNDILYDSFRFKKHAAVKSRDMIVKNYFLKKV